MCACDSKGARGERAQAGAEAVRRRARKQRHRNNRVGSVCGCSIHPEMGSIGKTIDFCPPSGGSSLSGLIKLTPL